MSGGFLFCLDIYTCMKMSQLKQLVRECVMESIDEITPQLSSLDAAKSGIQKLQAAYKAYNSFIPDVITYMKDPKQPDKFIVVARETSKGQYVRLSLDLPEEDAKEAAGKIKDFHTKYLESGLTKGQWKQDPQLQAAAQNALRSLKGGESSGDTGMIYKGKSVNEMYYFPDLNVKYYKGENMEIPQLSQKYVIYYRRADNGFYMMGAASDADTYDHYAYKIRKRIDLHDPNILDYGVYTKPGLSDKDKREIEAWSKKKEVQQRREFEKKNFPAKRYPQDYWTGD